MLKVDVFDQPRFCDEISHLLNRLLTASISLYNSLFNIVDILRVFEALAKGHIYEIEVNQPFHQFAKCQK